jgi:NAD(P)-dependent dehydrogenase (short-subunit alcohol dehydrogenase family)
MKLTNSSVIVTGGASGLGEACVRYFRDQGARVAFIDLPGSPGKDVAAETGAHFMPADVTDEATVEAAITAAKAAMGGLNVCVTCAGIATGEKTVGRDGAHSLDTFKRTIDINLIGTFNVARLAAAAMTENETGEDGERGVIVTTASVAAFDGQKGQSAYTASKSGVSGMTLPIARDLGSLGIRIMSVAPGIFRTPMLEGLGEEIMGELAKDVMFPRRLGKPEEFARLAAFIVTCPYLNGSTIRLDGGLRMP